MQTRENVWAWWRCFSWGVGTPLHTKHGRVTAFSDYAANFIVSNNSGALKVGCDKSSIIDCAVHVVGGQGTGWLKKLEAHGWDLDKVDFQVGDWRFRVVSKNE